MLTNAENGAGPKNTKRYVYFVHYGDKLGGQDFSYSKDYLAE